MSKDQVRKKPIVPQLVLKRAELTKKLAAAAASSPSESDGSASPAPKKRGR